MKPAIRRCAVYTRKSTEEGLDQAFNSLDAQREACEAYIKSQAHEGWKLVKGAYDDGGFSGGNLERPGMRRLMAEVKQGLIDVVVVYKVDRLTRSLADFAKIVEVLDGHGASFVSVTQQFNTTSSMGRLTLNVLLSFAQFEREVTGERIRDKIAASKRKGMWMGGTPPLGYDIKDRQLIVNETDADTVRLIYRRYLELGCVRSLALSLRGEGIVSKATVSRRGKQHGGQSIGRGALYHLLRNRLYRGVIVHKGQVYPGQHPAIVPDALWEKVQQVLTANRSEHVRGRAEQSTHLLAGRLRDDTGRLMVPTYTRKANGQQYRYYVRQAESGVDDEEAPASIARIPAGAIEQLVVAEIRQRLPGNDGKRWETADGNARREMLRDSIASVIVASDKVQIRLTDHGVRLLSSRDGTSSSTIELAITLKPRAGGTSIIALDGMPSPASRIDKALVRAIVRANRWREMLEAGEARTPYDLARHEGCRVSYVQRHLPLGFLAPSLVEAILEGKQPSWCVLSELLKHPRPDSWSTHLSVA